MEFTSGLEGRKKSIMFGTGSFLQDQMFVQYFVVTITKHVFAKTSQISQHNGLTSTFNSRIVLNFCSLLHSRAVAVPNRAVEVPKKKAGKKAPATGACRRLLRRLYIVN